MVNWAALLREKVPAVYPQITSNETREQIMVKPNRYCMLIRHRALGHWSGYVLVDYAMAMRYDSLGEDLDLSYCAPTGREITWMTTTHDGKLVIAASCLNADTNPEGDFWIGFSARPGESYDSVRNRLLDLEEYLWEISDR